MGYRPQKKTVFKRNIFLTDKYIQYFNPDDRQNPFFNIYNQKKQDTLDIIDSSVNSKTILDVGGGMGRLSVALAKSKRNEVFLTDISIGMLRLVANHTKRINNLKIIKADAHELPFPDNKFDYVVGLDLLCHLEKPKNALSEFHRVLTQQGMLILDSTNSNPLWALFYPRYLGKNPMNWLRTIRFHGVLPGWETIVKHYPKKEFFSLLNDIGFRVIQNLSYGPAICPKWHLAVSRKIN